MVGALGLCVIVGASSMLTPAAASMRPLIPPTDRVFSSERVAIQPQLRHRSRAQRAPKRPLICPMDKCSGRRKPLICLVQLKKMRAFERLCEDRRLRVELLQHTELEDSTQRSVRSRVIRTDRRGAFAGLVARNRADI